MQANRTAPPANSSDFSLPEIASVRFALESLCTQKGESLIELSTSSPVLVVFLRHAGCAFCREALEDLGAVRAELERGGVRLVLVHMDSQTHLDARLSANGLASVDRIHDPGQELYRVFGLKKGTSGQLVGLHVIWRAVAEGVLLRFGLGTFGTDTAQMPGVFLLHQNKIVRRFRHRNAAERPDYVQFCFAGR